MFPEEFLCGFTAFEDASGGLVTERGGETEFSGSDLAFLAGESA